MSADYLAIQTAAVVMPTHLCRSVFLAMLLTHLAVWQHCSASLASAEQVDRKAEIKRLYAVAGAQQNQRMFAKTEAAFRQIITLCEQEYGNESNEVSEACVRLAKVLGYQGRHAQAEPFWRRAWTIRRNVAGTADPQTIETQSNLGLVLGRVGKLKEADQLLKDSVSLSTALPPSQLSTRALVHQHLARFSLDRARYPDAESLASQAIAFHRQIPITNRHAFRESLSILGWAHLHQKEFQESESVFREFLAVSEELYGKEHRAAGVARRNVASAMIKQGKLDAAEQLLAETLTVYAKDKPPPLDLAFVHEERGHIHKARKQYLHAERSYNQAIVLFERVWGKSDPRNLSRLHFLQALYWDANDHRKRESVLRRMLDIKRGSGHHHDYESFTYRKGLAASIRRQGRVEEAINEYRRAIDAFERLARPTDLVFAECLADLAHAYRQAGQLKNAEELCAKSIEVAEDIVLDREFILTRRQELVRILIETQQYGKAEAASSTLLAAATEHYGEHSYDLLPILYLSCDLQIARDQIDPAVSTLQRAAEIVSNQKDVEPWARARQSIALSDRQVRLGLDSDAEATLNRGLEYLRTKELAATRPAVDLMVRLGKLIAPREFDRAEELFQQALRATIAEVGEDHLRVADVLVGQAAAYSSATHYAKGLPPARRGVEIRRKQLPSGHPGLRAAKLALANLNLSLRNYVEAEKLYESVLAAIEELEAPDDRSLAETLLLYGVLERRRGDADKSERLLRRTIELSESTSNAHLLARALTQLALVETMRGNRRASAEALYERSVAILLRVRPLPRAALGNQLLLLANIRSSNGQYHKAVDLYERANQLHAGGEQNWQSVWAQYSLAICYARLGRLDEASSLLENVTDFESTYPDLEFGPARVQNALGILRTYQGRKEEAAKSFGNAIRIYESRYGRSSGFLVGPLYNLARLYQEKNETHRARDLLLRALKIEEASSRDAASLAMTLHRLCDVAVAEGDLNTAWQYGEQAFELLQQHRHIQSHSPITRSFAMGHSGIGTLAQAVSCLALETRQSGVDPFQLLENAQAAALRELFSVVEADYVDGLAEDDRARIGDAIGRVNRLRQQLQDPAVSQPAAAEMKRRLQRAELDYSRFLSEALKTGNSSLHETYRGRATSEMVASPALDEQTAIVGWISYAGWNWAYVIRDGNVQWIKLDIESESPTEGRRLSTVLSMAQSGTNNAESIGTLIAIYRQFVRPLEEHLNGARHLVVVSQGWPARLPVEMLLTSKPTQQNAATWSWLGNRFTISYTPSATVLDLLAHRRQSNSTEDSRRKLLVLADPPFNENQWKQMRRHANPAVSPTDHSHLVRALGSVMKFSSEETIPRLPATRYEAQSLAQLVGSQNSKLLLGENASERQLFELNKSGELKNYRFLHIATHGYVDTERPELSGLVLALAPTDDEYDGRLQMREVFQLQLNADLVVLSACQTGLGRQVGGEGMVGLSTAFLTSGASALVMSLWSVPDLATSLLMRSFYSNLNDGKAKAEALSDAKRWLRNLTVSELEQLIGENKQLASLSRGLKIETRASKQKNATHPFAHPLYWAGFVLTGDPK